MAAHGRPQMSGRTAPRPAARHGRATHAGGHPSARQLGGGRKFRSRADQQVCGTSAVEESSSEAATDGAVCAEVTRRIRDLGRAGQLKSAMKELSAMADLGVQPDTRAATALLDACIRNNKLSVAESVFEDLFGEMVEPDDVTFCVMIRGFGQCTPPQWVAIKGALDAMKEDFGIKPTTRVYNTILEVCTNHNDLEMAESFVERMRMERVAPDANTVKAVQNRRALRALLRRLEDAGPDDGDAEGGE